MNYQNRKNIETRKCCAIVKQATIARNKPAIGIVVESVFSSCEIAEIVTS